MGKAKAGGEGEGGLISTQMMLEREKKYLQRLQDIGVSCTFIRDGKTEFGRLEQERANREHWEHHVRCDGLPRPYLPPEVRTFLAKKRHYQQFDTDHSVDWTLSVDERTLLTQDIFREDRTSKTMREIRDDRIGYRYENDIMMYLYTLSKIDLMFDNDAEMERVDLQRKLEIMEVRSEIEKEIDAAFDRLTYRIIRMDGVYMKSDDAMIATWAHICDKYSINIWALRHVPIRFHEMIAPFMVAEFGDVGVSVQMPLSVLHDCLTLRCLHTNFDTYTQYAKSYDPVIPEGNVDVNAGITDIEECLINEWLMQLEVQKEMLASMLEKREVYDDLMRIIAEKTERANREKKANDGKGTKIIIPKPPREPPAVPPDMLPDALHAFLEREQQQYIDFLEEIYNPHNLKMRLDEINLRQYILLGGVYSLMFLRRPANVNYQTFNMILHQEGRVMNIMEDVVADLRGPNYNRETRMGSHSSHVSANRSISKLRVNMDSKKTRTTLMIQDDELPYFFVTIKLPKALCMWGEPIPCHYITGMEDVVSEEIVEEIKESVVKKKKSRLLSVKRSELLQRPDEIQFTRISRPEEHTQNVFRPTLIAQLRCSRRLEPGERVMPVRNFSLIQQLDHIQSRQLERYCVPRVLSSFKFPQEVKEELEQQLVEQRPKTRNMLMRRRSVDVEENFVVGNLDFDYETQQAAERVYPVFQGIEHVVYYDQHIQERTFDKMSMYGLLDTFDDISYKYITRHRNIMGQPDFGLKKVPTKKTVLPMSDRSGSIMPKLKSIARTGSRNSSLRASHSPIDQSRSNISTRNSGESGTVSSHDQHTGEGGLVEEDESDARIASIMTHAQELVTRWTTKHILASKFDRAANTLTIKTDRLGIFGFAYKRYEHFPFRDWSLAPSEENNEEIVLSVDTFHARVILYISVQGIRGYVTDITKNYVAHPVKYLNITTPISDFRELRRLFYEKNVNIFAENDACFYIDNGYFSVKHMATEDHTYDAMALHCKLMKFYRSSWNRLASRRNILMGMKNAKDNTDYTEVTVRIMPDNVTFVEVAELCSDDLNVIKLDFKNTWRNMNIYTDLHQAIVSMNPHATDARNRDPMLLFRVKRMLKELRLMSFS